MHVAEENLHGAELLQAQAHVWNHIFNFVNSMSLKCAIQLGIPDVIHDHGKPMTLSELVAVLPIHPSKAPGVYRLMRILLHSGFFATQNNSGETEGEGYVLTNASQLLIKDNPLSVTPFLLAMLDPILTQPWHYVSVWFQNDAPSSFYTAHQRTCWEYAGHETKLNHLFNEAMASDARLVSSVLVNECKGVFEGLNSLVDVGGGTGTVAKAIAKEFQHLDCTVFDLPHVVAGLEGSENLKYLGGDMFEAIPQADAILLKWILHDWNDEECVKILKQCKEAIKGREGGKLIIIDMVVENNKEVEGSTETQLFFDMLMMILVTGKERNEKEWAKLFTDAGFSNYKINPVLGLRSLIEVYP
ncbi:trans-resveratrol di-O-methyltransferase-like [Populus nigra]|uniref:trans-resveratrol di-O-methyltransferase-like n=1 Tax=Populus nigra TaxID=3691 RepID=UPI002B2684D3|nr:trans-resveratrol di-O-methyltransferase-like [Populus nigra]